MIPKQTKYHITSTVCRRLGRACPACVEAAQSLLSASRAASSPLGSDFQLEGAGELEGCASACPITFKASADRATVACAQTGASATLVLAALSPRRLTPETAQ